MKKQKIAQYRSTSILDDKLFITEILNELHTNGFQRGGKAEDLLHYWAAELRKDARSGMPASRLKKTFIKKVGRENW
jgi:hypothetical protein